MLPASLCNNSTYSAVVLFYFISLHRIRTSKIKLNKCILQPFILFHFISLVRRALLYGVQSSVIGHRCRVAISRLSFNYPSLNMNINHVYKTIECGGLPADCSTIANVIEPNAF